MQLSLTMCKYDYGSQIKHEIGSAGVAYIVGGYSDKMMEMCQWTDIASALEQSALTGSLVISNTSAGITFEFSRKNLVCY